MRPGAALFVLPMALRVTVLSTEIFGIVANAFFVFMLLRYCRGWPSSKMLLASYHTAGLVFLLNRFFPLLVSSARGGAPMTSAQCGAPAVFTQLAVIFQLLCMAVMAHYRWKVVQAAVNTSSEPNVKRYIYGLLAVVGISVGIVQIVGEALHVPFIWTGMLCVRTYLGWSLLFNLSYFFTAPYLIYCYRKIITSIRSWVKDGGAEFVRLIYTLTVFYYITYSPFFVLFFLRYVAQSGARIPYVALQVCAWLFETHAIFSPVISIMMIKRYRSMAYSLLSAQPMSAYGEESWSDSGSQPQGSRGRSRISKKQQDKSIVDVVVPDREPSSNAVVEPVEN